MIKDLDQQRAEFDDALRNFEEREQKSRANMSMGAHERLVLAQDKMLEALTALGYKVEQAQLNDLNDLVVRQKLHIMQANELRRARSTTLMISSRSRRNASKMGKTPRRTWREAMHTTRQCPVSALSSWSAYKTSPLFRTWRLCSAQWRRPRSRGGEPDSVVLSFCNAYSSISLPFYWTHAFYTFSILSKQLFLLFLGYTKQIQHVQHALRVQARRRLHLHLGLCMKSDA
jgi:hypothetical protein